SGHWFLLHTDSVQIWSCKINTDLDVLTSLNRLIPPFHHDNLFLMSKLLPPIQIHRR
ncbi:Os05g0495300, partial [Oryza sativa Japonica Group]